MSPYITFKDTDKEGILQMYICQREFPHYVGMLCFAPLIGEIAQIPISGHNLWIKAAGSIRGNFYPSYNNVIDQIEVVMVDMATWFYHNRILKEPKRYKKFAILP